MAWLACCGTGAAASTFHMGGGVLRLGHQAIAAGQFVLGDGAEMIGCGEIRAPAVIAGIVSPGNGALCAGVIRFSDSVTFDSGTFVCGASEHETLDRIVAEGDVNGLATVELTKAPDAVPLKQIIIAGGAQSDYDGFLPASASEWQLGRTNSLDLTATDLAGDTDGDGLPDWWEQDHFGGRSAAGAQDDPDGDGFINHHEWAAGTDPWNAGSRLFVWPIRHAQGADVVRWQSVPDKRYALMVRTNLISGTSQPVQAGIVATGYETAWTNNNAGQFARFYRIKLD